MKPPPVEVIASPAWINPPRGTPVREDRDHSLVKRCRDEGPLQRRDTTIQGAFPEL